MGNTNVKAHPRPRNKKQVHWKAADRPLPPGKPYLSESDVTPDVLTIRWDRPPRDGGSPITGYLVEHRRTGSPHWVRSTPGLVTIPELTLSGLEPGWRYQFRVFAENVVGMSDASDLCEPLTVTLQRSAITSPRFLEELNDTVALENEKVEFVAHFVGQPPPKVCWFKDGFEIFSSRRTRIITESDRSVLVIHQSALADEGEIKCTATNRAGHASTKAKLSLEAPPSIRLPRQYEDGLLFEIGEVMRLKVSVAGRPAPLVFWSHNGESIQNDERYEIEDSDKASTLKIGEARRADRGEYQVKAVNKLGEDIASFLVTVTDKPLPPGKARVIMTLGRSVTLAWNTPEDDGGCKIGNYIVEYYRIGWNVWLKAATTRQLTTVLGDLIEGSEYKFRVKAESPYGISDPSEESDLIFIPDPKRGMVSPPPRSMSQPRDDAPPIAAKRKKVRSQSSSRAETPLGLPDAAVPVRPQRTKTKSTPTSPEPSPMPVRKPTEVNKQIYDRSSMAREMAYGSPEIKVKRSDNPTNSSPVSPPRNGSPNNRMFAQQVNQAIVEKRREKSPSPQPKKSPSPQAIRPPSPDKRRSSSPGLFDQQGQSPSPTRVNKDNKKSLQESQQETFGSSEFMLVLMPNGNKNHGSQSDITFYFDGIPPPLSLSSPELGVEPPTIEHLVRSASSTELLHERAMLRFYQEAAAEEVELQKLKEKGGIKEDAKQSLIPKIQINSKDTEDVIGLDRKHSIRRRLSAGGTIPQQIMWAQKRHSLRTSAELSDMVDPKSWKIPIKDEKDKGPANQRSASEEREDVEFEKFREKMAQEKAKKQLTPRNSIEVVEEEKWDLDSKEGEYDDIYSGDSSEDERLKRKEPPRPSFPIEEEDSTYHPRMMGNPLSPKSETEEPFEILTKPKPLSDPNFVPKPILKRRDKPGFTDDKMPKDLTPSKLKRPEDKDIRLDPGYISRERAASLTSDKLWTASNALNRLEVTPPVPERPASPRKRSQSLIPDKLMAAPGINLPDRRGSITSAIDTLIPTVGTSKKSMAAPGINLPDRRGSITSAIDTLTSTVGSSKNEENNVGPSSGIASGISAIAGITGLAAASIVIPRHLMDRKKHEEETKVIVDHYADIVAKHSSKRQYRPQSPSGGSYRSPYDRGSLSSLQSDSSYTSGKINEAYTLPPRPPPPTITIDDDDDLPEPPPVPVRRSPSRSSKSSEVSSLSETIERSPPSSLSSSPSSSLSRKDAALGLQSISRAGLASVTHHEEINKSSEEEESKRTPSPMVQNDTKMKPVPPQGVVEKSNSLPRKPPRSPVPTQTKTKRKTSPSPMRTTSTQVDKDIIRRSPSPVRLTVRNPKMKEIMTQTSTEKRPPVPLTPKQEELQAIAEVKVKSTVEYLTDLAMFSVACWFYFFSNELYAIPVLLIMVYRQLHEAIKKRTPKWLVAKWKKQ